MPEYEVELSDGRIVEVEADRPPTLDELFPAIQNWKPPGALGGAQAKGAGVPEQAAPAPPRALAVPPFVPSPEFISAEQAEQEGIPEGVPTYQTMGEALHRPLVDLPRVTGRELELTRIPELVAGAAFRSPLAVNIARQTEKTSAAVLAGLQQATVGATEFFLSPIGIATLGSSRLPDLAKKGVAGYFVYQMAKQSPDMVKELAEAWYANDPERLSNAAASLGLNTAFIAGGGKAIASRAAAPKPRSELFGPENRPPPIEAETQPATPEITPAESAQVERINTALEQQRETTPEPIPAEQPPSQPKPPPPAESEVTTTSGQAGVGRLQFLRTQERRESLTKDQRKELGDLEAKEAAQKSAERKALEDGRAQRLAEESAQEERDVTLSLMEENPELSLRAEAISKSPDKIAALDADLSSFRTKMDDLSARERKLPQGPERDALNDAYSRALTQMTWNQRLRDMVRVHQESVKQPPAKPAAKEAVAPAAEAKAVKIKEILDAFEAPERARYVPVERFEKLGSDGKSYSGDLPSGVKFIGRGKSYWVMESAREGTTHGKRFSTREELVDYMDQNLKERRESFRVELDKMDDVALQAQADAWIKKPVEASPTPVKAAIAKPAPKQRQRKTKTLLSADKISDFQIGRDRVERRGNETYVVDTSGQYAPIKVQGDVLTPESADRIRNLPPDKVAMVRKTTEQTPYLSPEGRAERLAIFDELKPATEPARTTAGEGQGAPPAAETKLANIVNETIEQSTSPKKLGVSPLGSTRPTDVVLGADDLRSVSPRAETRWQESVREKPSILDRLKETAVNAWQSITREYAGLPPREFPQEIDILRRLRASRNASARRTVDVLRGITHNLGPKQYGVFNRVVLLEDLLKDVEAGKYADGRELPSGHADAAELTADLNKFKAIAEATPEIRAALQRRAEFMGSLRETLVERGFLPETVLEDPRYFHHQVLMFMSARNAMPGAKSFRDWFSGWQKKRVGSSKAYNRQYVEAEAEVIADAFNKMTMQDLQGQMKASADLKPELQRLHGEEWAQHIPSTHTRWQPKRGNIFYPVKTVAERVMEEYLDGLRDILPEEFKDAVAIGPKRAEWIIPKELAKVLDNLAPRKDTWIERLAGAGIGAWKRYILLNPLRALKYQVNNASGDVDFVFAANPRIFKEFRQAAVDSYDFHKKGKAATGEIKEAIDLGVMQSGWRASELPDIGGSEYFNWLTGAKPGITDRYWKWISKWNDAREDTARLATYRFALKEWNANKPFYGASAPKDVAALPTNKLKAAKVARELLIDYGRETEFGEFMRRKAVPFYRWMHGNFARYVQLTRNIPVQEGAGAGRLAALGAKKGAVKAGALAARGAVAYMAINLWNNLFFPDEEEALGDTRNQLHLILGRDEQGNIQTIRFQGALSDLLGWVGLENLPQDLEDLFKGKASLGDKMEEGFEAGVSRAVNATSPFYKTAAEAMTGRSLYPNAFEPRPIRDKAEHVAGLFSLKNVYQWLAGKPHKPLRQELTGLLAYTVDPGEAAYNATRHMAAEWLEDRGEERSQTIPGKRANALYYYKQALRYKDPKLAAKFKAEYEAMGGKQEGLTQSIARSAPLASLGKKQNEFLQLLSPAERAVVDRAQKWYQQVYR